MTQPITPPTSPATPPTPAAPAGHGLPPIPPEVQKFADEVGAAPYLPGLLALVRRIYPQGELSVILIEDPEIEDYRHIGFAVDVTGWTSEQMLELWNRWSSSIAEHCPRTHAPYFLLRLGERRV
jgi:hypothetical protein